MSILGEPVLTASIELLLNKLASSELLCFARQEQIDADLKKWENILMKIYAVLEDAEEKQMTNRFVKKWLVDLKNLANDVEDILNEFYTKALERKLSSKPESSTSKVWELIPTCSTCFNPRFVKFDVKMGSEIKKITERLQEIVAQKNNLQLLDSSEGRSNKVRDQRLPATSSTEAHVYGNEKNQEAIVELLLKDDGNEEKVSVIPTVGIGGVGKTTLAPIINKIKSTQLRLQKSLALEKLTVLSKRFHSLKTLVLKGLAPDLTIPFAAAKLRSLTRLRWLDLRDCSLLIEIPSTLDHHLKFGIERPIFYPTVYNKMKKLFKKEMDDTNGGGGDDDNNDGSGGKYEKKDNSDGNGSGNNDKGEGSSSGSGNNRIIKRNQMKPMFGCKFAYHAGNENWCPVGQLQCVTYYAFCVTLSSWALCIKSIDNPNTSSIVQLMGLV